MFEKAKWIWNTQESMPDSYCDFYADFVCDSKEKVLIRLSADSNYALYINGVFADSGQYADYPSYKVYDELDITDFVTEGKNSIAIVVWYIGVPSFTYTVGKAGLIFEITNGAQPLLHSDETVLSRRSERFVSFKKQEITAQLGLGFEIDMRNSLKWMSGDDLSGFEKSVAVVGNRIALFRRENQKLRIGARAAATLVQEGSFVYRQGTMTNGEKMQTAFLSLRSSENNPTEGGREIRSQGCTADGVYLIVDLKSEQSGYLDYEIEVPEDCVAEVGWGEHLCDGRCRTAVGGRDFSVSVHLRKGQNNFFNPFRRLGGRYLQMFFHTNSVCVKYLGIRPTTYPVKIKEFESSNILRKKIYDVSVNTLVQCMHEHYEDCPWREQCLYHLDSRNQMLCGYYAFDSYEFPRSNLRLMANGIREDGLMPLCFPAGKDLPIPFFSLFYVIQAQEYLSYTQDSDTLAYCYPSLKKVMDTFSDRMARNGLVPNFDDHCWNFYEWREYLDGNTYRGESYDACLNAAFSLALQSFCKICEALGKEGTPYKEKAEALNRSIADRFYDKESKMFHICLAHDTDRYSVLANSLCVLCGAADAVDTEIIEEIVAANGAVDQAYCVIPATLSMYTFRFDALIRTDKNRYREKILSEIDETYLYMLQNGATSFWETLSGESDFDQAGSLCHGWSAVPIYYYRTLTDESRS